MRQQHPSPTASQSAIHRLARFNFMTSSRIADGSTAVARKVRFPGKDGVHVPIVRRIAGGVANGFELKCRHCGHLAFRWSENSFDVFDEVPLAKKELSEIWYLHLVEQRLLGQ